MNEKFKIIHQVINGRLVAVIIPDEKEEESKIEEVVTSE